MSQQSSAPSLDKVLTHLDNNLDKSLDRLFDLLRIKSISTDPAYKADCRKAAEWLVEDLKTIGFDASVRDTPGHPMVVAHHEGATPDAPHVLFYGHYDVQPVDPLNLWENDPFEPAIKDVGNGRKILTGRGTSDDKGQLMTFVEACRAYKAVNGNLPVKVTLLFEGEEESGSPSLKPFLDANKEELKADVALVCDTAMWDAETPAISVGLRGLVGEEIVIKAADRDLHSGFFGGAAANPIHILTKILADLHDETGRVTVPDFYEGVEETPTQILKSWESLGRTAENFLGPIGLSIPSGEKGRSVLELTWARRRRKSTASPAAIPAKASRPSSPQKLPPRFRSASSTNRTRSKSAKPSALSSRNAFPPTARSSSIRMAARPPSSCPMIPRLFPRPRMRFPTNGPSQPC
jgi:acetylornithine deacetylase/succinyl-diaminopimelate desuccinylase-like protein